MDDPNEPLPPPQPAPVERKLDAGNMILGCLNGVGIVVFGFGAFLSFVSGEPAGGLFCALITIGLLVLMFRLHFIEKKRSYLLGALLFIGFAALCFGLCVAMISNMNFN
jgi:hypothetical protein